MNSEAPHFLGLRTAIYGAPDLDRAKQWYTSALGLEPYFDQPFYVGYNVGGYELGLDPDAICGATGAVAYWGVTNVQETYDRLLTLGSNISDNYDLAPLSRTETSR